MNEEGKLVHVIRALYALIADTVQSQGQVVETDSPTSVVKSVDVSQRLALFVALEPETPDLHGDIYSAEEIERGCNNFNIVCRTANLFHEQDTDSVEIVQSFTSLSDFEMDNGKKVKKGTWLQWWYFPETEVGDRVLDMVQKGEINGISIKCFAEYENLEEVGSNDGQ